MSSPVSETPRCLVMDAGKLPAASGGGGSLCDAVERAMSERAPGIVYNVEIRVLSPSRLVATVTRDGHKLPEHNFASMGRDLTRSSFDRFAQALADQVANGQH
jgi:hypothetical protein